MKLFRNCIILWLLAGAFVFCAAKCRSAETPMVCVLVTKPCERLVPLKDCTNIVTRCSGEMKRHGNFVLNSNPPQYPHRCTVCGQEANYFVSYPSIEFVQATNCQIQFIQRTNISIIAQ